VRGTRSQPTQIHSKELRDLILRNSSSIDPFGVRLFHAKIIGPLDLSNTVVPFPLHFTNCTFSDPPVFEGADLKALHITDSRLPGLLANGVQIRRDLILSGSLITGVHVTPSSLTRTSAIWLTESTIGGRLLAVGTRVQTDADRAIQADRSKVTGDVRLVQGFHATAEVRLLAAQLNGSLDLTGSRLEPQQDGRALDVAEATIGGSVFFIDDPDEGLQSVVTGRIEMGRTVINGRLWFRRAKLIAPPVGKGRHDYNTKDPGDRLAFIAPGLHVSGEVILEVSEVEGGLAFPGAVIDGGVIMDSGSIRNPGYFSLDLSHAQLGGSFRTEGTPAAPETATPVIQGTVNLAGVRVAGSLDLSGAALSFPGGGRPDIRDCVYAVGARIGGDVRLGQRISDGEFVRTRFSGGGFNLRGAEIGGVFEAEGAHLVNPGDRTLNLHYSHVLGNVRLCDGFRSEGLVVLNRSIIEGRLRCDGGTFIWTTGPYAEGRPEFNALGSAFEAISATVRGGIGLGWIIGDGSSVNLTDTRTSFLADDPSDWPAGRSHITGLTFERFASLTMDQGEGVWDSRARTRWLEEALPSDVDRPGDPGPWEQVAQTLARRGDTRGAEQILINFARHERRSRRFSRYSKRALNIIRRGADAAHDGVSGYGFRPFKALGILAFLVAALAILLTVPVANRTMRTTDPQGVVWTTAGRLAGQCDFPGSRPTSCLIPDNPGRECGDGSVRCFNAFLYAVDTVVPIVDLKQRTTWYPNDDVDGKQLAIILGLLTLTGWAVSSVFVVGLARAGSRTLSARGSSAP
jgi:hypothetical protein